MFSNLSAELDFLGDGDAVLGDARGAERLVDDDVAALGAERDLHGVGEDVDAVEHALTGIAGEFYFFGSHWISVPYCLSVRRKQIHAAFGRLSG